ncbi:MAG: adenine phosphoribosyltransferase [Chloroflexi bacterium]|nr:adenine phosphoribosyltransferase [Chloroflexota bacterium]
MTSAGSVTSYEHLIREIPDFPEEGILFRDITPLLLDPVGFAWAIDRMTQAAGTMPLDVIVAVEARGYLFGAPMARALDVPLIPVRKVGKLPYKTVSIEYALEYGSATVEMHEDGIHPGQRAVLVDDLLATGGTLKAAEGLVHKAGGITVGATVLIELAELSGRALLGDYPVHTLMHL